MDFSVVIATGLGEDPTGVMMPPIMAATGIAYHIGSSRLISLCFIGVLAAGMTVRLLQTLR